GNIKALRNTRVTLDISANNPITTADIVFSQGTLGTLTRTGRSSFRYSFLIAENGSYHINLVDILQNRSRKITRSITAIPDRQPEIKIIYPGRDTLLNQNMLLPLKIQAADDFGLQDLKLYYHVNDEPQDIISIVKYISSNLLDLEYQFDLSEIFLIPGDRITYWTAISDNSPEIQTATSNKYMVRFPSIEEIYHEIEEEERIKSEILQNTWEKSQELREDYEEIRRDLLKKDELDWEDRKQLEDLLNKQQNLNQDIMKMAQDYQELIDKFRDNQALSQETLEKMDKIKDLMEEIASEELLQAMEKLRESLESVDPETWRKAMEDFRFSLEDFSQKLDQTIDLLEQIKKEQAMQKSLEIAEEMEEMQNKLNERTANQEADNQQLAQEQQNIRDKLQSLQEQLEKTSALLDQEKDQEVLEAMEELMQQMDRDSLDQDLQESQQNLMENQNQKAQESQQNASHKMQNMTARLSQMQQMLSSGFMMEVTAIIDDSIKRLLIFSYEQERSSLSFSGDPYTILATQIANFEGINLTLQKLYSVPMIVLVLGPKFIFDANLTLAAYRELFQYINEAGRIRLNTYLDNIQKGINLMIYDLLQAGSNMQGGGGGMQSLMQALQQMGQQQMLLNMATQQLLQQMGEEGRMSGDMMTEARRLARDEERLAENLKRALQNDPEAQKQTAALNQIIEDLQSISRNLQQGILNQEMIDLQDRILSRLLDAQKSVHKREFSRQRKSEISDIDQWELPEDIKLKFDKMRQKALLNEEYKKYPQEYQELIREYLRLLNEKIDEKQ
ncbi:MAG: hypothetical protein JXB60_07930, partial [Candidatus Cloacimonetes bacterium]|nr:hypothetical protein [Candidatus Cloacimonadota bacterium]